jgi:hypothetical protein
MSSPHADSPQENPPPGGLTPEDAALLAGDVPPPRPDPEPVDWQARVLELAERTRPARQAAARERTLRQQRIDAMRRRRIIAATLDRLDACVAGGVTPAVAVSVPALLDGLRPGREPIEDLHVCEEARLLLLDDLAAERVTDWTSETLYRLVDARYARRLPTIVTTNASGQQIRDGLGERVASRLNGLGRIVTLDGPDRRAPTCD